MKNSTFKLSKKNLLKMQAIVNGFNRIYNLLLDCPCDYNELSQVEAVLLLEKIDNVFVTFIDDFDSVN